MSTHWHLAARYAAWVSVGAVLVGAAVWLLYGVAYSGAFLYGAGVGIASFVSTAFTVSMLTGRSNAMFAYLIGSASFMARYGFVAVALGIPAYMGLWPVVAMLIGFVGAYLAENVVLLPRVLLRATSTPGVKHGAESSVGERTERRVEV